MILGATNGVGSDYNIGTAGEQFGNGCAVIKALGPRATCFKGYCTPDHASANYRLQTWPDGITTLTELAQTTPFTTQFTDPWWTHIVLTVYTFANGSDPWWISNLTQAKLLNDYNEAYAFVAHLLSTYSGSGKIFVLQRWENDWTLMNGSSEGRLKYIPREYVDRYAAYLGNLQRAVEDARASTAHTNVSVVNALECNLVVDRHEGRPRVIHEIAERMQPDWVSWSAYDGTINSETFTWGASLALWAAHWEPIFRDGMRALRAAFPGKPIYIGEVGFPENEVPVSWGADGVAEQIQYVHDWAQDEGAELFLYWNTFANDLDPSPPPTYRGLWLVDDNGNTTDAHAKMTELANL